MRSRSPEEVRAEAHRLADAGHKEIVLVGIHLGHYGRGETYRLPDLIRILADVPVDRIRLSSLEAIEVTEDLLDAGLESGKLCPHFHLPLQSGNDRVLRRMGRPYTRAEFARRVEMIRDRFEEPAISTDVIVGFPGEDDAAFAETLAFCREIGFSKIHVFPYSERSGTAAIRLGESVPIAIRKRRGRILGNLGRDLSEAFASRWVGREVELLTESWKEGFLSGKTERYLPARVGGEPSGRNQVVRGIVRSSGPAGLEIAPGRDVAG
ncbi:MAG: radical SAM protein [Planctomycetota bacterium]|nr:radical SAM protein [Planctomycetota bacterium]